MTLIIFRYNVNYQPLSPDIPFSLLSQRGAFAKVMSLPFILRRSRTAETATVFGETNNIYLFFRRGSLFPLDIGGLISVRRPNGRSPIGSQGR